MVALFTPKISTEMKPSIDELRADFELACKKHDVDLDFQIYSGKQNIYADICVQAMFVGYLIGKDFDPQDYT